MKEYDALIIGFGKGGKTLAGKLAAQGKRVALVEKSDQMYGGTCINVGCIPSKSLVLNAQTARRNQETDFIQKSDWYARAIHEKRNLTAMLRGKNFAKLDDLPNVTIYNGTASFISNTKVKVQMKNEDLENEILEAGQIFINTGGTPVVPEIEGLQDNPYVYYSETLMDLEILPKKLVIIGGGYIGLEFASIYSGFGSEVTVLQDGETLIKREDRDIADAIKSALESSGVAFRLGAKIERIHNNGDHASVTVVWKGERQELEANAILVATGRKPNTAELNAQAAGVELTSRGAVKVDENRKTTTPNIWAMGDVVGGLQFTYVSLDDFRIVWSQLNGGQYNEKKRQNVPYSVFIHPSFSRVGMNEDEARKAGYHIKIAKLAAAAIPKAQVLKQPVGLLKAIIDEDTNKILGAMLFCEESYEMINLIKLAMDAGLDYQVLRDQIYTHPTMSEAFNDLFAV